MTTAIMEVSQAPTQQATNDAHLIELWLHGRSKNTQGAYQRDVQKLLTFTGKGLRDTTLGDIHSFSDSLDSLAPTSKARILSGVKSLLSFGHRLGYLSFDVGKALRLPTLKNKLSERILDEHTVMSMLALEPKARNKALLRLLYATGMRVSEVCNLTWKDVQVRGDSGQVTVYGKGGKTRFILLSKGTWADMIALRGDAQEDEPIFRSQKGGGLDRSMVLRIVKAAAERAGIKGDVSPHWLRHAHASHALDRGAPVHLVQATLGHASLSTTSAYVHARPNESSSKYLAI